ncbi:amidohydrolase [Myxococcota bacterium]|nr:amidohydrolase [Myxococcota bacterium]
MVDSHVHVVSTDLERYPLKPAGLPGAWYLDAPCPVERFTELMDEASVQRAVLVQGVGAYGFDNAYTADSAERFPERFASVACVDAVADDPPSTLEYWIRQRGMGGVRLFALIPPSAGEDQARGESWLAEAPGQALWRQAGKLGAHVVVTVLFHQLPELRRALIDHPDTTVSLDHCGFPPLLEPPWREAEPLEELINFPNLHLKVTSHLLHEAAEHGDPQHLVSWLVERFGAERIQWGSDFSQTHDLRYPELVALGRKAFAHLSPEQRDWCLGGTALQLWPGLANG